MNKSFELSSTLSSYRRSTTGPEFKFKGIGRKNAKAFYLEVVFEVSNPGRSVVARYPGSPEQEVLEDVWDGVLKDQSPNDA